ncbi:FG-GAP-like repeat-containing protein [Myxococcus sp. AB025B]|uniref:FG-GAP-like repeat-containing protein n=1 Tax=Myxococcus sp. AB025B TaxID=2562794 RepID=UPI0018919359|nr:FG-GAP-like repeat-containing protein [Myxococcus sp. AB025B]
MKRLISLLTLGLYGVNLLSSCGPASSPDGNDELAASTASRLSGTERLLAPAGTVVDTNAQAGVTPGATEGSYSLTADGAATYSVPLWVPPGRAGMQPELALSYNSRSGAGLAGVGFTLGGTPSRITRCRKSLAQDGVVGQVRFDRSDAFCLDGARLVHTNPSVAAYGANGSEYRTEVDTFARVTLLASTASGPPDSFEVRLKNGRILTYAARLEGARVIPQQVPPTGVSTSTLETVRFAWALSEVKDRQGNYMRLLYSLEGTHTTGFEHLLTRIEYTGSHTDASVALPRRSVVFNYEPGDVDESYVAGFKLRTSKRLERIEMFAPDVPVSQTQLGATTSWRSYSLKYREGSEKSISGRSLLKTVTECDGRNVCKAPTTFSWGLGSESFTTIDTGIPDVIDNDARYDSTKPFVARDYWTVQLADVNGDGKDDLLYRFTRFGPSGGLPETEWRLRLSTGSGFGEFMVVNLPEAQVGDTLDDLAPVDMDMDGKTDILAINRSRCVHNISGHIQLYRFNGSNFTTTINDGSETYAICGTGLANLRPPGLQTADLNADGLPDLLRSWRHANATSSTPAQWAWRLNPLGTSGTLNFPAYTPTGIQSGLEHAGLIVDVDGDGASEVLLRKPQSNTPDDFANYYTAVGINSDGSMREVATTLSALPWDHEWAQPHHYLSLWMVDVTGDGLPDALTLHRERQPHSDVHRNLKLAINTGNGFLPPQTLTLPAGSLPGPAQWSETGRFIDNGLRVLDFNMDGRQDLLLTEYYLDRGTPRRHLTVLLSTGTGFTPQILSTLEVGRATGDGTATPGGSTPLEGSGWGQKLTRVGDINGDGLQDIVQVAHGTTTSPNPRLLVHLRQGGKPDLLQQAIDGHGKFVRFEHRALRGMQDEGRYTPGTCTYPQYCGTRGMWVVSSYAVDNGQDDVLEPPFRKYDVSYAEGRTDLRGRGWLGFGRRVVTDTSTNATTTTVYDNVTRTGTLYLHAGSPKSETVNTPLSSGTHSRVTTFLREARIAPEGLTRFLCQVKTTVIETEGTHGDVSASVLDQQCDAYGNVTSQDTFSSFSATDTVGNRLQRTLQVENHPSTWVLGLPRRVTDTSTSPPTNLFPSGQQATRARTYQYCASEPCPESNLVWRTVTEPEGSVDTRLVVTYARDLTGQVTSAEATHGGSAPSRQESVSYDNFEKLFPTVGINAEGHRDDTAHHPALGVVALTEDANGVRTRRAYDGFGRLRIETAPYREGGASAGPSVLVGYALAGRDTLVTVQRAGSPTVVQRLDRWERPVSVSTQAADGRWTNATTEYDFFGRPARTTQPRFEAEPAKASTFTYDNLGRLLKATRPDGAFQEWVYKGRSARYFDELRNWTATVFSPLGQPLVVEELEQTGSSVTTIYSYGPFGLLEAVRDYSSGITSMEYDVLGRRTKLMEPKLGPLVTEYDAFGDVRQETDAGGRQTTYGYDRLGREVLVDNADGLTRFTWDTAAHGVGGLAQAVNERSATTTADDVVSAYTYDTLSRPTQEALTLGGATHLVDQSYDSFGRPDTLWYPAGPGGTRLTAQQVYTATGYPLAVKDASTGAEYWRARERDAAGRLLVEARGANVLTTWNRYDHRGRLRFIESRVGATTAGSPLQSLSYSYNTNNSLSSRHDTLKQVSESFQYDGLDRLKRWTVQARCDNTVTDYGYNTLGNLTSKKVVRNGTQTEQLYFQYGAQSAPRHALTGVSTTANFSTLSESFTYDAAGNQTNAAEAGTGRFRNISYTAFNLPATLQTQQGTLSFTYDAFQRRTLKQHGNGDSTLYVGGVYEKRRQAGVDSHVFLVLAEGRAVAQVTLASSSGATPVTSYLLNDYLGSVETVTDAAGTVLEQRKYQPFGAQGRADDPTLAPATTASSVRLGFTSHEWDDESGLVNMKGRLYDPKVGRFLTPDPVVQAPYASQSLNRYSYVLNNPLRYVDPSGFSGEEAISSVMWTGPTADGEATSICGSPNPSDCISPTAGSVNGAATEVGNSSDGGDSSPAAIAGGADKNGGLEPGVVQSSCRFCVGDGRGLFAFSDKQMDDLQGWARDTKWAYVPGAGLATTSLNLMLSLMRGNTDNLASEAAQVVLSFVSAKVVGVIIKKAAPVIVAAIRPLWSKADDGIVASLAVGGCFIAGTPVLTAKGLVPIEEVAVGDWVWAWDEETKVPGWHRVSKTFIKPAMVVLEVMLESPDGTRESFGVTAEHPFGVVGRGWTEAQSLGWGDEVESAMGERMRVVSVASSAERKPVFNFEVEDAHTYFVGESTAWVHNSSSIARRLFPNTMPEMLAAEMADAKRVKAPIMEASLRSLKALVDSGERIKYVVLESGQLIVAPHTYMGVEIKHAVLSAGRAVLTAGEAQIARAGNTYFGLRISSRSGHFMPTDESVAYARAAFAQIGITFPP